MTERHHKTTTLTLTLTLMSKAKEEDLEEADIRQEDIVSTAVATVQVPPEERAVYFVQEGEARPKYPRTPNLNPNPNTNL